MLPYRLDHLKAYLTGGYSLLTFFTSALFFYQIVSRNMTNLTPAQLEEFESTFRHFDNNQTNSLTSVEFNAALASLGIMYEDEEFAGVFAQCSEGGSEVTFEQVSQEDVKENKG